MTMPQAGLRATNTAPCTVRIRPKCARARLVRAGDDTLPARLQRLADAETSCCSFFTFILTGPEADVAGGAG